MTQSSTCPGSLVANVSMSLDAVLARNPAVSFIVPPCKGAVLGSTSRTAPTQRDLHIRSINEHGRMNWQKTSGYNRRSKVEAAIGRYKALDWGRTAFT
jgi:hypothetical protein